MEKSAIAELDHQLNPIASRDDYRIPFPVPAYHPYPHGRNRAVVVVVVVVVVFFRYSRRSAW